MGPVGNPVFPQRVALALGLCLALAACSKTGEPVAEGPIATPPSVTVVTGVPAESGEKGPRNTGAYPDFSRPLTSANLQMTDEEATGQQAKLTALASARKAGTISEAEYRRRAAALRNLASQHGQQTIDEIAR